MLAPRIARAVQEILRETDVVSPIEVVQRMGLLTREQLEDWRRGRVPYLERVVLGNLTRLSRLLRLLRQHAHDLKLAPSLTVYVRHGGHREKLRFTKSGDPGVERAWSTHLIAPGRLAGRLLCERNRPPAAVDSSDSESSSSPA